MTFRHRYFFSKENELYSTLFRINQKIFNEINISFYFNNFFQIFELFIITSSVTNSIYIISFLQQIGF